MPDDPDRTIRRLGSFIYSDFYKSLRLYLRFILVFTTSGDVNLFAQFWYDQPSCNFSGDQGSPFKLLLYIPQKVVSYNPINFRLNSSSGFTPAKSSNAFSVTSMMCSAINGAPSAAPCSADLMQSSHSNTAQPP